MPPKVARRTVAKYGASHGSTPGRPIWFAHGSWKCTIRSDEVLHNFCTPHTDLLEQFGEHLVLPEASRRRSGPCVISRGMDS